MLNYQRVRLQAYVFNKKKKPLHLYFLQPPYVHKGKVWKHPANPSISMDVFCTIPGLVKAARHSWLFGASLTAMRNLGLHLGYTLVHLSDVDRVGEILRLGLGDYGLNL